MSLIALEEHYAWDPASADIARDGDLARPE